MSADRELLMQQIIEARFTAAYQITLEVMREHAGTPDGAIEAFDPTTFLMIFEMIMEIIAECQAQRGDEFSAEELLERARGPSRRHRRRSVRIATGVFMEEKGMGRAEARAEAKVYVEDTSRAAMRITAQQINDAIAEEENAFATVA